jgi:transcriptional regulator with XRE-family HTH domain
MTEVHAQAKLRGLLRPEGELTAYGVAKALSTDPEAVARWARGDTRPSPHFRSALERLYGIPADDWMTEAERTIAFGEDEPGPSTKPSGEAA